MAEAPQPPEVEPPAYTPTIPAPPTTLRRTIEDTRQLIFANASLITGYIKGSGRFELVIGKTRAPGATRRTSDTRSFVSTTSNVTIRVRGTTPPPQTQEEASASQRSPSPSPAGTRMAGKHYAALVSKHLDSNVTDVILLGEPQSSIEEALEWLLDRTEIVVTEMLANHRRQVSTSCCRACGQALVAGSQA